jgi:hypothetical protein
MSFFVLAEGHESNWLGKMKIRKGHEETVSDLPLTAGLPMKTNVPIKMGMCLEQVYGKFLKYQSVTLC